MSTDLSNPTRRTNTMRTKHTWNVTLQREDGEIVERKVRAFWDPTKEGCSDAVGETAKAEAWWASGKRDHFHPIAVALDDPPPVP